MVLPHTKILKIPKQDKNDKNKVTKQTIYYKSKITIIKQKDQNKATKTHDGTHYCTLYWQWQVTVYYST